MQILSQRKRKKLEGARCVNVSDACRYFAKEGRAVLQKTFQQRLRQQWSRSRDS